MDRDMDRDSRGYGDYGPDLSFNFYQPTRIVFGDGVIKDLGLELKRLGVARALLVTDQVLRTQGDLVPRAEQALGLRLGGIYDGALPDAPVDCVDAGGAVARQLGCDGVVSLGGGSVIDTAKGIALLLREGGSIRDHQGTQRLTRPLAPHVAIPTTAGTGAEVTAFAVLSDPVAREKMHYMDDHLVPNVAILDPSLTLGLPARLTAATGMDALTHAVESYQTVMRNPLSDANALHAIRLIARWLPVAVQTGHDRVARGQMLLAASMAGLAFNAAGLGLAHAMSHVIGARHHVHHGTANAICLPHVMRFNADEFGGRQADIAAALGVAPSASQEAQAQAAAAAVARLVADVGLPTRLRDVGVPESDLESCAEASLSDGAIVYNGKFAADRDLVLGVYRDAY